MPEIKPAEARIRQWLAIPPPSGMILVSRSALAILDRLQRESRARRKHGKVSC